MLSEYEKELCTHYAQVRARLRGAPPKIISAPIKTPEPPPPPPPEPVAIMRIPEIEFQPDLRPFAKTWIMCGGVEIGFTPPSIPRKTFQEVVKEVSRETGVSVSGLLGHRRQQSIVIARQYMFYRLALECPHLSIADIGRRAGKDHTSVLHGIKKHCARNDLPPPR